MDAITRRGPITTISLGLDGSFLLTNTVLEKRREKERGRLASGSEVIRGDQRSIFKIEKNSSRSESRPESRSESRSESNRKTTLTFLSGPMKFFFSAMVWNLPWPNLELVSMNLRLIFSSAHLLVCTSSDCSAGGERERRLVRWQRIAWRSLKSSQFQSYHFKIIRMSHTTKFFGST